jgi:hypothetical protein
MEMALTRRSPIAGAEARTFECQACGLGHSVTVEAPQAATLIAIPEIRNASPD